MHFCISQISKIDFNSISKSFIHDYLAGQYILLDFDTDWLLPVYILNDKFVRAQSSIIHIHDLQNYVQTELHNGDFILKRSIPLEHNYIELSSQYDQEDNSENNNKNENNQNKRNKHVHFNLPSMKSTNANPLLNGLMTNNQGKIITQATQQANEKMLIQTYLNNL